jgi:AcrR family transcriptional regulator
MRADAEKNYRHLLAVARDAVSEHGADASLRDIARRAGVGLATLYRHFPTREALLEALLSANLDELTQKASQLETSNSPGEALKCWFHDGLAFTRTYGGVVALMAAALEDPDSALHASCTKVRSAGARLLERAQAKGVARADIDGTELFALMGALAWIGDQPAFTSRADHLSHVIANTILTTR